MRVRTPAVFFFFFFFLFYTATSFSLCRVQQLLSLLNRHARRKWNFTAPSLWEQTRLCCSSAVFAANEARADIDSRGASWSLQSAGRRQPVGGAALPGRGGLQSSGSRDGGSSRWQRSVLSKYGGTRTQTHTHRLCAVFFLGALTAPKVDLCKNAVRIGNSSRLRGRRGLSRGAQNLLRAEESTAEKQVSWEAEEDSYSPSCGAFGVEVIIGGCWLLWELSGASPPPPVSSQHPSRWPRSQVVSRSLLLSCWTWSYATFGCCLVNINFKY